MFNHTEPVGCDHHRRTPPCFGLLRVLIVSTAPAIMVLHLNLAKLWTHVLAVREAICDFESPDLVREAWRLEVSKHKRFFEAKTTRLAGSNSGRNHQEYLLGAVAKLAKTRVQAGPCGAGALSDACARQGQTDCCKVACVWLSLIINAASRLVTHPVGAESDSNLSFPAVGSAQTGRLGTLHATLT